MVTLLDDKTRWDDRRSAIVNIVVHNATKNDDVRLLDKAIEVLPAFDNRHAKASAETSIGNAFAKLQEKERGPEMLDEVLRPK